MKKRRQVFIIVITVVLALGMSESSGQTPKSVSNTEELITKVITPEVERLSKANLDQAALISEADRILLNDYPASRVLSSELRKRLILQALASVNHPVASLASADSETPNRPLTDAEKKAVAVSAPQKSVHGFVVIVDDVDLAKAAIKKVLAEEGWETEQSDGSANTLHVKNPKAIIGVRRAWELAYTLSNEPGIGSAEPDIEWIPVSPEQGGPILDPTISIMGADRFSACSSSSTWSAKDVLHIDRAWKASPEGKAKGTGIIIGHLDTGVTVHSELPSFDISASNAQILYSKGANIYDPERTEKMPFDPMDPSLRDFLRTLFPAQIGHGTQTLSVLLGQGMGKDDHVMGTAPKAKVIPFRISPTVVHWNARRLAEGIRRAKNAKCNVITISMGGPPTEELKRVVREAADDGIIICSAAGNIIGSSNLTPIVVWPAALDQVIAVGGTNCEGSVWSGSARGPEVNISAPAQNVWRATALEGAKPGTNRIGGLIGQGDGTSYATPATAGAAACWLAAHGGPEKLAERYGHKKYIPMAFAYLLRTVAFDTHEKWRADLLGPGTLNAEKLIKASLPRKSDLSWPQKKHTLSSKVLAGIFKVLHLLDRPAVAPMAADGPTQLADDSNFELLAKRHEYELIALLMDRPVLLEKLAKAGLLESEGNNARNIGPAGATRNQDETDTLRQVKSALQTLASDSLKQALQ